ncbi:MAG: hypothetical protein KDC88_09855 [Ignavibacteriae bacterium]|nr:hypothetical protein [Ignavibacteriota bacterium]MCB9208615.1 hypothetical protein [Ignavibacteriales bacterium]MCB9258275.1 hypothetical protein [Ignavibacteriales bacterium]
MYFKAKFYNAINEAENLIFNNLFRNPITGKEVILFNKYEFEIERNIRNEIDGITFCSQCVNTYGIETEFIKFIFQLLQNDETVKLYDSNGLTSEFSKDDIEEYIS